MTKEIIFDVLVALAGCAGIALANLHINWRPQKLKAAKDMRSQAAREIAFECNSTPRGIAEEKVLKILDRCLSGEQ